MSLKKRQILLLLGDIFLFYLSLFFALFLGFWKDFNWQIFIQHFFPFSILYFFWLIIFYIFGLYELNLLRRRFEIFSRIFGASFSSFLIGIVFFYLIPGFGISPKTNLFLNILILAVLIFAWRRFFLNLFSFYFLNKVAIIGENPRVKELENEILNNPHLGYKLVLINPRQNLFFQIQKENIDLLIVAQDLHSNPKILKNLYNLIPTKTDFIYFPQIYEMIFQKIPLDSISESWFLENLREGEKIFYDKIKRLIDICFAFILLLITFPLWLLIALAIKLEDGGPIFYRQERIGKNKEVFLLIKFRSMKEEAEKESGAVWAEKEDPRVTRAGKILRRFHLDELPQMINILKGDISLTGPRPERPEFVKKLEKEIPYYHLRHLIKPGFTGWAQIKFRYGRSIMDSFEKFQYDLYYIKNRSFLLDLQILLKTFQLFFKKE